jgi:hypothetical protein
MTGRAKGDSGANLIEHSCSENRAEFLRFRTPPTPEKVRAAIHVGQHRGKRQNSKNRLSVGAATIAAIFSMVLRS